MPELDLTTKSEDRKALQWTGSNIAEVCDFVGSLRYHKGSLFIPTHDGALQDVPVGGWIVRDGLTFEILPNDSALDERYDGRQKGDK